MNDLISRQAAIDAIKNADVCMAWNGEISAEDAADIAVRATKLSVVDSVEDLPSVQPERKMDGDAISRSDAIRVASGYCHPANVAKELAKLPSVQPERCEDCENFSKTRLLIPQPEVAKDIDVLNTDCISRQVVIDTEGLDEQIRCEMCRNPMHTDRGCDGNCKYDEKLYERIMQILSERMKPLSSVQPEIIRCKDCKYCDKRSGVYDCHNPVFGNGFGNYQPPSMRKNDFCSRAERRTDEPD